MVLSFSFFLKPLFRTISFDYSRYHFLVVLEYQGLAVALESAGFEVLELGLWGNSDYAQKLLTRKNWPSFHDLNKPVENDPMVPAGVWALARRPDVYRSS